MSLMRDIFTVLAVAVGAFFFMAVAQSGCCVCPIP
jgi:hypothetical protein